MNIRRFNKLSGICAAIISFAACNETGVRVDTRPNIICIVVDDLGWSDLGCYGADLHETPHIDNLAEQSLVFTQGYSAAPVCSPTRASIMTGKYPARLNFTIWSEAASPAEREDQGSNAFLPPKTIESLPHEEVTLAEKLREAGYLTIHIGKWHIGDYMHFPETQGFDVSFAASQRGAPPTFFYPYRGHAFGEYRFVDDLETSNQGRYFTEREGEYLTDRLTDEALKIIGDAGNRPFYMNLWYYNVHTPIEAKEQDVQYFREKITPEMYHQNETYAAMVRSVDENVGRILHKLRETRLDKHTIIVLISDNGGYINPYNGKVVTNNFPLRSGKGSLYEGGIRIPWIVSLPGESSGARKIDTPVSTIDLFPTLLEMAGIQVNTVADGVSLARLIRNETGNAVEERPLFWHYPHYYPTTTPVSAVRKGNWKLLEYLEDGRVELYNLERDTSESENVAEKEKQITEEMLSILHTWKISVDAKGITVNPH